GERRVEASVRVAGASDASAEPRERLGRRHSELDEARERRAGGGGEESRRESVPRDVPDRDGRAAVRHGKDVVVGAPEVRRRLEGRRRLEAVPARFGSGKKALLDRARDGELRLELLLARRVAQQTLYRVGHPVEGSGEVADLVAGARVHPDREVAAGD